MPNIGIQKWQTDRYLQITHFKQEKKMKTQKTSLLITICIIGFSCSSSALPPSFDIEVEKWKTELFLNGEVGPPCIADYNEWSEMYPDYYWGMQEIQSIESDFNSDGIQDALFYFPAENCVGGNGKGSDFAMLVYSHKGQLLTNKNITKTIEHKIKYDVFAKDGVYDIYSIRISYSKSLLIYKTIRGSYRAWVDSDANCCPSYRGTFEYNPFSFSIVIKE